MRRTIAGLWGWLGLAGAYLNGDAAAQTGPAPTGVQAVATGPNAVTVSWSQGTGVVGFAAGRNCSGVPPTGGCQTTSGALAATASSWNDSGLQPATQYTYTVAVRYADGRIGVAQASVTTPSLTSTSTSTSTTSAISPKPIPTASTEGLAITTGTITVSGLASAPEWSWPAVKGAVGYSVTGTNVAYPATIAAPVGRNTKWRWPAGDRNFPPGTYDVVVSAQLSNGLVAEAARARLTVVGAAGILVGVRGIYTATSAWCKVTWDRTLNTTDLWVVRHPTSGNSYKSMTYNTANAGVILDGTLEDGCYCPPSLLSNTCHGTYTVLMLLSDKTWRWGTGSL